ncbi:MAG: hypothetical protein CM15mP42_03640 [Methanobacteriota archaeon]|nr:MAG: hypothetical protein CM15mP42_03640 [Euryarchaeota archaeon]
MLELKQLDPSYRVFFDDGEIIDISSDIEKNYEILKDWKKMVLKNYVNI